MIVDQGADSGTVVPTLERLRKIAELLPAGATGAKMHLEVRAAYARYCKEYRRDNKYCPRPRQRVGVAIAGHDRETALSFPPPAASRLPLAPSRDALHAGGRHGIPFMLLRPTSPSPGATPRAGRFGSEAIRAPLS